MPPSPLTPHSSALRDLQQFDSNIGGYIVETVPEPHAASLLAAALMIGVCRKRRKMTPTPK